MKRLLLILLFFPFGALANELRPFVSDGCSAFPDGTIAQNDLWLSCCKTHDHAYWKGGTYQDRIDADDELESCVAGVGEPEIARLMRAGVRVGGSPYLDTSFRWGYGWTVPRGYQALTEGELLLIQAMEKEGG